MLDRGGIESVLLFLGCIFQFEDTKLKNKVFSKSSFRIFCNIKNFEMYRKKDREKSFLENDPLKNA